MVNQAPHQLDLLHWYMGEIDEIYGSWANLNHPYIEVEDTAIAVIRFKSGALGNVVLSNSQNPALFGKVENPPRLTPSQRHHLKLNLCGGCMSRHLDFPFNSSCNQNSKNELIQFPYVRYSFFTLRPEIQRNIF